MRARLAVLVALSVGMGSNMANALSCSGNACDVIQIQQRDTGCIVFHNSSGKPVKIDHNAAGISIGTAYANSDFGPTQLGDGCMKNWVFDYSANYQ
mgnify:CR=1 FL=1